MKIIYKDIKNFNKKELENLFLSVNWSSGNYPEKLVIAFKNFSKVFSAWDDDKLIGIVGVMDDKVMTAYVHYLLVDPKYQKMGIGKNLLDLVKDYYKDYIKVLLISYDCGTDFYKKCGFKEDENKRAMYITNFK